MVIVKMYSFKYISTDKVQACISEAQASNAPFMLQAVCPAVTGVSRWWNHLPGRPILSEFFTLQAV